MKKLAAIAYCLLLGITLNAQEVYYALPRTTFTVEVQATRESFYAGPYSAYAHKLLNLDVQEEDEVRTYITSARIIPHVEADPSAWYTTDAENATFLALTAQGLISFAEKAEAQVQPWRFPATGRPNFNGARMVNPDKPSTVIEYTAVQTDTGLVNVPIEHKILVQKTLEEKAADAAETILNLREGRVNLITGDTDASFGGNAMEVALKELDRLEKEYMALFQGFTVSKTFSASFEILPAQSERTQRYQVFRLLEDRFAQEGNLGVPYYLVLEPETLPMEEEVTTQRRSRTTPLYYRTPVICKVSLITDGQTLLSTRVPVYQMGRDGQYPNSK